MHGMSRYRLHLIWFLHQPFFVPDDEILWRIDSTYLPLIEALGDRSIKCSLGITGSLLERCARLRPDFIAALARTIEDERIMLLGTAAYHPILPWLSARSARAQIFLDRQVKAQLGLPVAKVFWPTELAWSMRVGALAVEFGYEAVVVDNCSRDAANLPPQWRSSPDGLSPVVEIEQPLGIAAKIETEVHCANAPSPITLWVRERALSNALLEAMYSEEENDERHFKVFSAALESTFSRAIDPTAPLVLADDPERYLPNRLARLLGLLDSAISACVEFVSPREFVASPCKRRQRCGRPQSTTCGSDVTSTISPSASRPSSICSGPRRKRNIASAKSCYAPRIPDFIFGTMFRARDASFIPILRRSSTGSISSLAQTIATGRGHFPAAIYNHDKSTSEWFAR